MQRRTQLTWIAILLSVVYAAVLLTGCSGGGGTSTGDAAAGGNVALYFSDAPIDFDSIWLHVRAAYLIPADDGDKVPIFVSKNPDGVKVDLLDLKDQKFLVACKKNVPPGVYSKIRLEIIEVYTEGGTGPCADGYPELKLPSGKIDLNPRGSFRVVKGETLSIHLDWDMEKSIHIKEAGNSNKCILRPVVFVDIDNVPSNDLCTRVISGRIKELIQDGQDTTGFILELPDDRGDLEVHIENAVILDEDGNVKSSGDLATGQVVNVRGRLNSDCNLDATVVVIGEVEKFAGTVVDSNADDFTLKLVKTGQTRRVDLTDNTIIYIGCDQSFDGEVIPLGYKARVISKLESGTYSAIVVFLTPDRPAGLLTDIDDTPPDGYDLTILIEDQTEKIVFLPEGAPVKFLGDGEITIDRLIEWVECPRSVPVEVVLDPSIPDPLTAKKLLVVPDEIWGKVTGKTPGNGVDILETESDYIAVEPTATIYELKNGELIPREY
ncbi:MAG: DUF4382 domain-containing protein, partial [Deltaproteobacteria bacterium]|nr:DUF4382 domain-containing protein [Deltaproteobacteria bacterium]